MIATLKLVKRLDDFAAYCEQALLTAVLAHATPQKKHSHTLFASPSFDEERLIEGWSDDLRGSCSVCDPVVRTVDVDDNPVAVVGIAVMEAVVVVAVALWPRLACASSSNSMIIDRFGSATLHSETITEKEKSKWMEQHANIDNN